MFQAIDQREPGFGITEAIVALAALLLFGGLALVTLSLPEAAEGLAGPVEERIGESGLGNAVNAVLLNFRAFDTLMEKAVLLVALAGLWGLTPKLPWSLQAVNFQTDEPPEPQLHVLLKVLVPLSLLSALYLLWLGADEPGGAFQGGTLLAAIAILLVLSHVLPAPAHGGPWLRSGALLGFFLFAGAGVMMILLGRAFLDFPPALAKPLILLVEAGITLSVGVTLFLLASGLPRLEGERP